MTEDQADKAHKIVNEWSDSKRAAFETRTGLKLPDQADKEAAEMFPCNCEQSGDYPNEVGQHSDTCKMQLRPAAAKLRELYAEIDMLKHNCEIERETFEADQAEIAKLREENGRLSHDLRIAREVFQESEAENDRLINLLKRDHSGSCVALRDNKACDCGWNEGDYNADDELDKLRAQLADAERRDLLRRVAENVIKRQIKGA